MEARVQRALAVLELEAQHPSVQSASFLGNEGDQPAMIQLRLSTESFKTKTQTEHTQILMLKTEGEGFKVIQSPMQAVSAEVQASTTLHRGVWSVNFKVLADSKKRILEIVHSEKGVQTEVDVTDIHADFLTGEQWGEPQWLREGEGILVYVAECHPPNWKDDDKPISAYEYQPHLGERLSTNIRPALFLLDFRTPTNITVSAVNPSNLDHASGIYFRQPTVAPRAGQDEPIILYAVGSSLLPDGRRPGAIWCNNRPDNMFQITVSPDCSQATAISITSDALSVRYPRVLQYHGGSVLVYLSNTRGGEHSKCARLHKRRLPLNLASQEDNDVLVDIVYQAETPETFPGLYTDCPASQFTLKVGNGEEKKTYLVLSSIWRCRQTILTVDLETGAVIDQGTGEMDSYTFLGSDNRTRLLAVRSSLITPPELVLGILEASEQPRIKWKVIKTWAYDFEVGKHFIGPTTLYSTIVPLPGWKNTEALVVSAYPLNEIRNLSRKVYENPIVSGDAPHASLLPVPPSIMNPHGGPSSADTSFWRTESCLSLIAAGYTAIFVNYPGSLGYGQDFVEELAKAPGEPDVLACIEMQRYLVQLGIISEKKGKRLFSGWSHGGFIGAHLSVRWPKEFDAINIVDPVIDLPSNFATSDIPDWQLEQFGVKYDFANPPSYLQLHQYEVLKGHSPSSFAVELFAKTKEACVTPSQIILSGEDKRVPSNQGINWYHCLKGHKQDVKLIVFPKNGHCLSQLWARPKQVEARLRFLGKYSSFA